jgi:regulator of sigma E protease
MIGVLILLTAQISSFISLAYFIFLGVMAIGIVAFVHELGHFLGAKLVGVPVEEFFLGLPGPRIFSVKSGETTYGITWILVGGYNKLFGEMGEEIDEKNKSKAFYYQPTWKKLFIVFAGPFMNYLLAVLIFSFFLMQTAALTTVIDKVLPGTAAEKAGLRAGDKILMIDQKKVRQWADLVLTVKERPGEKVTLQVDRSGEKLKINVVLGKEKGQGFLGVAPKVIEKRRTYPEALLSSFIHTGLFVYTMGYALVDIAKQGNLLKYSAGPVGAVYLTAEVAKRGWQDYFFILAAISLMIGVVNLLPILPTDGGRLLLHFWEGIRGERVNPQKLAFLQTIGFLLFGLLFIYLIYYDIFRIFTGAFRELIP